MRHRLNLQEPSKLAINILKILTGVSIDAPLSPSPGLPFNLSILFVGPGVSDAGGGEFLDE